VPKLPRFSAGVGDRFASEGRAQIRAARAMRQTGVELALVWNKSFREHSIIGSSPADQRAAADAAVKAEAWDLPYFVDADHIGLKNLEPFLAHCDFFTIDVADAIGLKAPEPTLEAFLTKAAPLVRDHAVPGLSEPIRLSRDELRAGAERYLEAAREAGRVYRRILQDRAAGSFVVEVSMDETAEPQGPAELLLILAALAAEGVPADTIAPKFSGRFNKGVDYVGNPARFREEFRADLCVASYAAGLLGLPPALKLSVHSGSDKFTLYPLMAEALAEFGAGLHLKTAGTSWLEELVGLAESGASGLALAKEIYARAMGRRQELCAPYAQVVDIDPTALPGVDVVRSWSGEDFAAALRHEPGEPHFNPHVRQLLHVSFKVAAEMGEEYRRALALSRQSIERNVTANLLERHFRPLFGAAARGASGRRQA